jgi:hypothetical protein
VAGVAALALAAALAVAGCTSATAGASAGASATAGSSGAAGGPALTQATARQAFDAYVATSNQAARTGDGNLALSVVTGAQQALVDATVDSHSHVVHGTSTSPASAGSITLKLSLGQYTYGAPTFYLPEPSDYPGFFLVEVTRTLDGTSAADGALTWVGGAQVPLDGRVLMVFEQSAAGEPWQLGSVSQLPAGVTLPRLATDQGGYIPQVSLFSSGLLAQPYSTGPLQAAVVDDGPASAAAKVIEAGPLTTGLYQAARDRADTGLTVPTGDDYQWSMEGTPYPAFALRTADGGALVLYAMYLNTTIAVPGYIDDADPITPGASIEIPADLFPFLPDGRKNPRVQLTTQNLFSFAAVDPPPGSAKVTVLSIGGSLAYATAT